MQSVVGGKFDKDKETARFHVVLLPLEIERDQMVGLSNSLNLSGDNVVVLGTDAVPHITLYNPEIPAVNIEEAMGMVSKLAGKYSGLSLEQKQFVRPPRGDEGLFINYQANQAVLQLRKHLINKINSLREGVVREKWVGNMEFQEEIEQYGYPLSQYHFPHVTLAKFSSVTKRDGAFKTLSQKQPVPFTARSIAVVETGPHGTAQRIIKEFLI